MGDHVDTTWTNGAYLFQQKTTMKFGFTLVHRSSSYVRSPKCLELDVYTQGSRLFRLEPYSKKINFD